MSGRSYYVPSSEKYNQLVKLGDYISSSMGERIIEFGYDHSELWVIVDKDSLTDLVLLLKDDSYCLFKQLIDITAIDYPQCSERFMLVYHFLSLSHNLRIRVKLNVGEGDMVSSLTSFYGNANWLEREVWDMFGVYFKDHNDLRRILTDFGFEGHPLRKDFPLTGFVEMHFNEVSQQIEYQPVKLSSAYRNNDKINPWLEADSEAMFQALKHPKYGK